MTDPNDQDPLDISKGCLTAFLLSLPFWILFVGAAIWMVLK